MIFAIFREILDFSRFGEMSNYCVFQALHAKIAPLILFYFNGILPSVLRRLIPEVATKIQYLWADIFQFVEWSVWLPRHVFRCLLMLFDARDLQGLILDEIENLHFWGHRGHLDIKIFTNLKKFMGK